MDPVQSIPVRHGLAGSIPYEVIGFFDSSNPSSRIIALESTQPVTEMNTRNLPGGKRRPAREPDRLTAICESIVYKMWEPEHLITLWAFTACYRDSFTFFTMAYFYLLRPILFWI
jgi:hypothetical protein